MRTALLSNGSFAVSLGTFGEVRDLYFPHVGQENHIPTVAFHRLGVFVDGAYSLVTEDPHWRCETTIEEDALVAVTRASHEKLGLTLHITEVVYNEKPILVREVRVENHHDRTRVITLFFTQTFEIAQTHVADTAYYDPASSAVIHYKGSRVFLASADASGRGVEDYAVGLAGYGALLGTYKDAEDGILSKSSIEHGPVDSTIAIRVTSPAKGSAVGYYWLCASTSIKGAKELDAYARTKTPRHLLETTRNYWKAWVHKYAWSFYGLGLPEQILFKKSLMLVRAHADDAGGIVASLDSDTLQQGKDTYAYIWPRDAALSALALSKAGDPGVAKRFFTFAKDAITDGGYFMHKYLPDGSLGSSWHPWVKDGKTQLPIQEDETALMLISLYEYYEHSKDLEFIESLYTHVIERAGDFLVQYRDPDTGLPGPSYDLWEEGRGIFTFTASAVFGALVCVAKVAALLGKEERSAYYKESAEVMRAGILKHLYDEEAGYFVKSINPERHMRDLTIDMSSCYGVYAFGVLPPDDSRLVDAFAKSIATLRDSSGGIIRYEHDAYYREGERSNPWFITTLWYAEYCIARANTNEELEEVRRILTYCASHALPSGVLSEQLKAGTLEGVSVAPLAWSHAGYVHVVINYLNKLEELGVCVACNPAP